MSSWLGKRAASQVPAPISVLPSQKFEGVDGSWSLFPLRIGTPPQTVNVLVSTASSQTLVVDPQGCVPSDPANCSTLRGGFFDPNVSSTWTRNGDASGGLFSIPLEWDLNVTSKGSYGYDTVILGGTGSGGPSLDQQVVAAVADKGYYIGHFGLNPPSSVLPSTTAQIPSYISKLNESNLIPSLSWSYTAGAQYRPGPAYGSLVLGGYDSSRFVPNDVSFPFNTTASKDLMVNIGVITLISPDDTIATLTTDNESIPAFIDSTTPYIILPPNLCAQFEESFGITWNEGVQAYLVNDTLHSDLKSQNTSVIFTLGNAPTAPESGFNVTLPYDAFDLIAGPPLLNNASRYFPLMRASNDSEITLGRTFLQEA